MENVFIYIHASISRTLDLLSSNRLGGGGWGGGCAQTVNSVFGQKEEEVLIPFRGWGGFEGSEKRLLPKHLS